MKNKYMDAVKWMYGFNNKEAKNYIKQADTETLNTIMEVYKNNTRKCFEED